MPFYVRKISRGRWEKAGNPNDINADIVTSELRTSNNTLSFWKIDTKNDDDINKAIIALLTCMDRIDTMDIIIIDDNILENGSFVITPSDGGTPIFELKKLHRDITEVKHSTLGIISSIIYNSLSTHKRINKQALKKILTTEKGTLLRKICRGDEPKPMWWDSEIDKI